MRFADLSPAACRTIVGAAVLLMLSVAVVGTALPMGIGWDFANFYDGGRKVLAGQIGDLYDPTVSIDAAAPQGALSFYGTPISAFFFAPMAAFEPETAMALFKIENTLAYAAAFALLAAFCRRFLPPGEAVWLRFLAAFAVLLAVYQPLWTVYRVGGQTTPTVLLLLVVAVAAHADARFFVSALAVMLAVLIKPALALAYLFLLAVSPRRYRTWALVQLAAVGLLSLATMGVEIHFAFLDKMREAGRIFDWTYNSSLYVVFGEAGEHPPLAAAVWALKAVAAGSVVFLYRRWSVRLPRDDSKGALQVFAAIVFTLVLANTVWEHYLAYLLPLWAYGLARADTFTATAKRLFLTIVALCLFQNIVVIDALRAVFSFDSRGATFAAAMVKAAPLYLLLVLLWVALGHPRQATREGA